MTPPPGRAERDGGVHATAEGFDRVADVYDQHRPGYPVPAVDLVATALGIGPGRRVLDLAAGTGKLTREWVARGAEVVAVEPLAAMREVLARQLPEVELVDGRAEGLPLPDAAVEAATVGHAFHWFDGPAALSELHRILAPGSHLAVLFNRRDTAVGVQAAVDELLMPHRGDTPSWASHDWPTPLESSPFFTVVAREDHPFTQQLDEDGLAGRVASVSFVAQLDDRSRRHVFAALHAIFAASARTDPDGIARVELAHVCEVRILRRVTAS